MQDLIDENLKPDYEFDGISIIFIVSGALGNSIVKKIFSSFYRRQKNLKFDFFMP